MNSAGARHETKKRINNVNISGHLAGRLQLQWHASSDDASFAQRNKIRELKRNKFNDDVNNIIDRLKMHLLKLEVIYWFQQRFQLLCDQDTFNSQTQFSVSTEILWFIYKFVFKRGMTRCQKWKHFSKQQKPEILWNMKKWVKKCEVTMTCNNMS